MTIYENMKCILCIQIYVYCRIPALVFLSISTIFDLLLMLVQAKQLSQLLDEDPALTGRRQQCAKRLELYKAARDEIDSVSWAR